MTNQLRIEAEETAYAAIAQLRTDVVGLIADAPSLTGYQGRALRASVERLIKQRVTDLGTQSTAILSRAFTGGAERATSELSGQFTAIPASLSPDVSELSDAVRTSYDSIAASAVSNVTGLLTRAALKNDYGLEDLLSDLRDRSVGGAFNSIKQRTAGTISEVVELADNEGYVTRTQQILSHAQLQAKATGSRQRTASGSDDTVSLVIQTWQHFPSGQPRINHIAMHGKSIPVAMDDEQLDTRFLLIGKYGQSIYTAGPKQAGLPPEEYFNCHCRLKTTVRYVTRREAMKIIDKAKREGGYQI